jgi:hypothetical protein
VKNIDPKGFVLSHEMLNMRGENTLVMVKIHSTPLGSFGKEQTMNTKPLTLAPLLRTTIAIAAAINLIIGLLFLFGPELEFVLWPSPLPREMMRFVGSIVIANGIGAAMIVRKPTWENARVLIAVALMYGALVFLGLLVDLLAAGAPFVFWVYLVINTFFLIPAGYFFWKYEQAS